jgi:hypothetical protein
MTTRTATGPFSLINYGVGWDVGGTPANGDTFVVNTGTAIMVGGRFPGSTVDLGREFDTNTGTYLPNPNLVLFGNTDLGTIDVTTQTPDRSGAHLAVVGHATVGAIVVHGSPGGTELTGTLAPGSRLTTHFEGQPRTSINLTGGTLDNEGSSVVGAATISSNIHGHGSFEVLGFFGSMHIEGSVSAGQSFKLDGVSNLTVDHPADFHATVDLTSCRLPGTSTCSVFMATRGPTTTISSASPREAASSRSSGSQREASPSPSATTPTGSSSTRHSAPSRAQVS